MFYLFVRMNKAVFVNTSDGDRIVLNYTFVPAELFSTPAVKIIIENILLLKRRSS